MLTGWLLLLLGSSESYGWALFGELRDRGLDVEQSLAYRDLRELERDGLVTSRWTHSEAGPQRRSYRVTPKGREALADLAATITAVWELHDAFVRAHQAAPRTNEDLSAEPDGTGPPPADGRDEEHPPDGDGEGAARQAPAGDDPAAVRPGRELLAAWLLLLLQSSVSYGYELRQELDRRDIRIDPATLYRVLRKLERAGWLQSRWLAPAAGPRRRLYRVTPRGRRNLDELVGLITRTRDTHGAFLRDYAAADPM
ncbi:MAG: hypothetical protein AVDCRST_MAG67-4060 [uncultured Solirubrobacteraceae bacterium]|uniref:Transcription regulator PadR N-terminal domain-containing protein n=1 Tax=uncultured Solirubrobacteraceae bacterium TaxID=1162706 RepID=A0A6J4TTG9_9ACTN|nr:MAG: hypothetical protein AVDCRST_MAG67-4060 [uncultured Solirubrobacteraceae bacterium]